MRRCKRTLAAARRRRCCLKDEKEAVSASQPGRSNARKAQSGREVSDSQGGRPASNSKESLRRAEGRQRDSEPKARGHPGPGPRTRPPSLFSLGWGPEIPLDIGRERRPGLERRPACEQVIKDGTQPVNIDRRGE